MKNPENLGDRLAVCSWSLQPADSQDLAAKLLATGIRRVQLALDPLRDNPKQWGSAPELLRRQGINLASGMFGCLGEDYATLETIRRTGGIAPDETWEQNWKNIRATATLARQLELKLVTFHAGFLPHEDSDPQFPKMLHRLREIADIFGTAGLVVGLETGQESAPVLLQLLKKLERKNVGVNFDPANMILYDRGDPVTAVRTLAPWIRQVHLKDANRTKVPGTWGEEVPVGRGEVDWPSFFQTLEEAGFAGNLIFEREAGQQRVEDIRSGRLFIEKTLG